MIAVLACIGIVAFVVGFVAWVDTDFWGFFLIGVLFLAFCGIHGLTHEVVEIDSKSTIYCEVDDVEDIGFCFYGNKVYLQTGSDIMEIDPEFAGYTGQKSSYVEKVTTYYDVPDIWCHADEEVSYKLYIAKEK